MNTTRINKKVETPKPKTPLVKIKVGTLCIACLVLPVEKVLVGTHV